MTPRRRALTAGCATYEIAGTSAAAASIRGLRENLVRRIAVVGTEQSVELGAFYRTGV
jgi:hypothetical protein